MKDFIILILLIIIALLLNFKVFNLSLGEGDFIAFAGTIIGAIITIFAIQTTIKIHSEQTQQQLDQMRIESERIEKENQRIRKERYMEKAPIYIKSLEEIEQEINKLLKFEGEYKTEHFVLSEFKLSQFYSSKLIEVDGVTYGILMRLTQYFDDPRYKAYEEWADRKVTITAYLNSLRDHKKILINNLVNYSKEEIEEIIK